MGFGAKKKIGWSELVLPVREGIPEKNLAFGHCRKWGGEPPAQIDFDTFLKANKLLKLACKWGAGGGMPKIILTLFYFGSFQN